MIDSNDVDMIEKNGGFRYTSKIIPLFTFCFNEHAMIINQKEWEPKIEDIVRKTVGKKNKEMVEELSKIWKDSLANLRVDS